MTAFLLSIQKILPLYFLVVLGFIAGKTIGDHRASMAKILIYIMSPMVIFTGVIKADLGNNHLFIPLIIFTISSILCVLFLRIGQHFFKDSTKNILAFGAGNANSGYFAIPVGVGLFGAESLPFFVLTNFGFIFYEYTVAYFVSARGHHTPEEAFKKVIRLPAVYAFVCALLLNVSGIRLTPPLEELATQFRGCYAVLGMMLIGFGVASLKHLKFDFKYLSLALIAKFIVWPLVIFCLIIADKNYLHFLDPAIYRQLFFFSSIPMAANTVAVATELKTEPEKAALAVLVSTLLALLSVPLATQFAPF
jgi:predicted permease